MPVGNGPNRCALQRAALDRAPTVLPPVSVLLETVADQSREAVGLCGPTGLLCKTHSSPDPERGLSRSPCRRASPLPKPRRTLRCHPASPWLSQWGQPEAAAPPSLSLLLQWQLGGACNKQTRPPARSRR